MSERPAGSRFLRGVAIGSATLALIHGLAGAAVTSLSANGTDAPATVNVTVGEPVDFEATIENCRNLGGSFPIFQRYDGWYYRWDFDNDGTWDQTEASETENPCSQSPITATHTYTRPGRTDAVIEHGRYRCFLWWCSAEPTDDATIRLQVRPGGGGGGLAGFEITHVSTTASTCSPTAVTVEALNNDGNRLTNYTGTVTVSTSSGHGDWIGDGTMNSVDNGSADDGEAQYAFDNADDGRIVLDLANEHADDLTITVSDAAVGVISSSDSDGNPQAPLSFRNNAFVVERDDPLGQDLVAGRDHGLRIAMVRRDPSSGACDVAQAYDGDVSLKAWVSRHPDDPGGVAPMMDGPAHPGASLPNARTGSSTITLRFIDGVARPVLVTSDVGRYALNLVDDTSGFAVDSSGDPREIAGSSQAMTARPFGFDLGFSSDPNASSAYAESGGSPDPDGTPFKAAGDSFVLTIRAVLWSAVDDDGPEDGIPDPDADLSDNVLAQSFGEEGVAETVDLGHTPSLADMDEAGTLTLASGAPADGLDGFSGGQADHGLAYDEVGIIDLSATLSDGDYLYNGRGVNGATGNVGRFHPAAFEVALNQPEFDAACGDFTYLGQPFGFLVTPEATITAVNTNDVRVRNYEGSFWRLGTALAHDPSGADGFVYGDQVGVTGLSAPTSSVAYGDTSEVGGLVTLYLHGGAGEEFVYDKPAGEVAPFDADVRLQVGVDDGDAAGSGSVAHIGFSGDSDPPGSLAATNDELLRFGRLAVINAYGSEMLPLQMPLEAEYFDGNGYIVNGADACTAYDAASVSFENFEGGLGGADVAAYGNGTLVGGEADPANPLVVGGTGGSDTGPGVSGAVDVVLGVAVYLRYDWDPDAAGLEDPRARASFGIYRGSENVIYQRELY